MNLLTRASLGICIRFFVLFFFYTEFNFNQPISGQKGRSVNVVPGYLILNGINDR